MTADGVVLTRHGGADVDAMLAEIAVLYEVVYSEPPYNGGPLFSRDRFLDRTHRQKTAPGFELITARAGGELVGFSFGFTFDAGRWWGGRTEPPPSPEVMAPPKFAVIELVVAKQWRGQGISSSLMRELLAERSEPLATLLSEPDAHARRIYEHWGWQHAVNVQPADDGPWMHALVLPLNSTATT
jgi:GNAT superfamily N-acetyltransferase